MAGQGHFYEKLKGGGARTFSNSQTHESLYTLQSNLLVQSSLV